MLISRIELKIQKHSIWKNKMLISKIEWNEPWAFLIKNNETIKKTNPRDYVFPLQKLLWLCALHIMISHLLVMTYGFNEINFLREINKLKWIYEIK